MMLCPFCAEEVKDEAVVCKHCGRNLRQSPVSELKKKALRLRYKLGGALFYGIALGFVGVVIAASTSNNEEVAIAYGGLGGIAGLVGGGLMGQRHAYKKIQKLEEGPGADK